MFSGTTSDIDVAAKQLDEPASQPDQVEQISAERELAHEIAIAVGAIGAERPLFLARLFELRAGHSRLADDREQGPGPQLAVIGHRHCHRVAR